MRKKISLKLYAYVSLFILFTLGIIMLKIFTSPGLSLVYIYTVFITIFMLSRVMGSFLYKPYREKLDEKRKKLLKSYFPSVSFVIPCKNEEKVIYHTISKCSQVSYPKDKIEIIAINDGSTDNTLNEMLRAKADNPEVRVVIVNFEVNKGKREGMYVGFKKARGEIVIQVDSDSYPAKNALKKIIEPFIDTKVGATVGHTDPSNYNKNTLTKIQRAYYYVSFRTMKATESIFDNVFCCSGCFSAYRKSYVLPKLDSWLKETFFGKKIIFGDDRALTNLILRQGYKAVYVSDAQAYTVVPEKFKQFLKQQVRWKKGWFLNSIYIIPHTVKKEKFIAITYLIPQTIIAIATPFIAFKALVINPVFYGISPWFYIMGIFFVSFLLFMQYNIYSGQKQGGYILLWSFLNMTIFSYIMLYALYDLRNMSWGTR